MHSSLPAALLNDLEKLPHFDRDSFLAVHDAAEQQVSIHLNPFKKNFREDDGEGNDPAFSFELSTPVPWAPDAWYLSKRPFFTRDPLFHAGKYYVQEASGMFLAHAMKQTGILAEKIRMLDLCAAPGGKSTMIQSLISKESLLVSNEVIKSRVPPLHQNITKWGQANGFVSNNDPSHFKELSGYFQLMLIDAPCSGSGLFRKDPQAIDEWTTEGVHLCAQRQQRIIADVWDSLQEGGFLIYSTCSYSKEENEDILDKIFRTYSCRSCPLDPDPAWNIVETVSDEAKAYGYRFYPDKVRGEGFFIALIQKTESVTSHKRTGRKSSARLARQNLELVGPWIQAESLDFIRVGDSLHAIEGGLNEDFDLLKNSLYLKKAGIRLGEGTTKEWIPDHELALSGILSAETAHVDLTVNDALAYLRGEIIPLENKSRGWQLVRFAGHGLGWLKQLDNRMNNYYPKSWRIRQ